MVCNKNYALLKFTVSEGKNLECYFDNSATTKPAPSVVDAMVDTLTNNYGNPSSLHKKGDEAKAVLDKSRGAIANAFSCQPNEVYFTSGGTESNNIAIMGTAMALSRRGKRIVTTAVEHPSVSECMNRLETMGFEVVRLPVNSFGVVREEDIFSAVNRNTILVSMMLVNNEVGAIEPISAAAKAVRRAGAVAQIHCDAVQGFGKIPVKPRELGVDLISVSSHKVHGPKGQGALYVKKGTKLTPYVLGGGQEENIRSGTHGMPGIAGFAAAVSDLGNIGENYDYVKSLKNQLLSELADVPNLAVNSPINSLPYILNLSLVGVPSEVLRNFLSERDICVSTGSACSKGHRSKVLTSMKLPAERIDSAIRISFSRFNTREEVDFLAESLKEANNRLRKVV